jgi:hypothetical protein
MDYRKELIIIEKENAHYWKLVRKRKKTCLLGFHFKRDFTARKFSACLSKTNRFIMFREAHILYSEDHATSPKYTVWAKCELLNNCKWHVSAREDYHVADNPRGKLLAGTARVRSGLWTAYFCCSNEEMSRLWTRSGNAGICWPWFLRGSDCHKTHGNDAILRVQTCTCRWSMSKRFLNVNVQMSHRSDALRRK